MKKISFALSGLLLPIFFVACNNDADTNKATTTYTSDSTGSAITREAASASSGSNAGANTMNAGPLNTEDSTFAMMAAAGNMFEVEAGNLARRNAVSERVKSFGAMMVQDHKTANQELMQAAGPNFRMPNILPQEKRQKFEQLRNLRGREFDTRYMNMEAEDHRNTLALFQKEANSNSNNSLQAYAQRTLPVLEKHLDSAIAINSAIK